MSKPRSTSDRKYRKVDVGIWNDAKFMGMSHDARLLFLLVLTHQDLTTLGAMKASVNSLADDLRCSSKLVEKALDEIEEAGMVEFDKPARLIAITNFFRYNPPDNPNAIKHWGKAAQQLPECDLRADVMGRANDVARSKGTAFLDAFLQVFPDMAPPRSTAFPQRETPGTEWTPSGMAFDNCSWNGSENGYANRSVLGSGIGSLNQEQEQEQEPEQEKAAAQVGNSTGTVSREGVPDLAGQDCERLAEVDLG